MGSTTVTASAGRLTTLSALWLLGGMVSWGEPAADQPLMPPEVFKVGVNLAGGEFGKLLATGIGDSPAPGRYRASADKRWSRAYNVF